MINIVRQRVKEIEIEILLFYQDVKNQQKNVILAIEKNDKELLLLVAKREQKINQKYNRIFKNTVYDLAKYSLFGSYLRKILAYSYISNELEKIANHICGVSLFLLNKKLLSPEKVFLMNFLNKSLNAFIKVEKLFFLKDVKILLKFLRNTSIKLNFEEFFDNLKKIISNHSSSSQYPFNQCFRSLQRIFDHLKNIVEYLLLIQSFIEFKEYKNNKL